MKFTLRSLSLALRSSEINVSFADVSYFWGQMGAGKTSIARLVDYCLGGGIEFTPALQNEFVSATLTLSLATADLSIERDRDADTVVARWHGNGEAMQLALPARDARGEKMPGVEVLSDLIFMLSGIKPPRVRRSKQKADSEMGRLSIRDLLWYCYLDQDHIDSSFFHLEGGADNFRRLKSRDVLRYVIGFHDERVAELEAELDELRGVRMGMIASIESLTGVLKEVGVGSEAQIQEAIKRILERESFLRAEIEVAKATPANERPTYHVADQLRSDALQLAEALQKLDRAMADIREVQDQDRRHLNELETLGLKFRRSTSARAVLSAVAFESCPRCAQALPTRSHECCSLCGQSDVRDVADTTELAVVERDIKARSTELRDILTKHEARLQDLRDERASIVVRKARVERARNDAAREFDSAYLAGMLAKEKERAALLQEVEGLEGLIRLPKMLDAQREALSKLQAKEAKLRAELREAKDAAAADNTNLDRLGTLFLDCLVRSRVPGITGRDIVDISNVNFFPNVHGVADETVTSFATLSSGGKKTLFKCCFAIAVHRLASELNAPLPTFLIIDSPMKNISERENRQQFVGFYDLVYSLKAGELRDTQIILIDKEFASPNADYEIEMMSREMRPGDPNHPPLIPNYNGK